MKSQIDGTISWFEIVFRNEHLANFSKVMQLASDFIFSIIDFFKLYIIKTLSYIMYDFFSRNNVRNLLKYV